MRNKIQAPGKQVLHKQVPKAQAIQKEKDPRLVAVGGFGQDFMHTSIGSQIIEKVNDSVHTHYLVDTSRRSIVTFSIAQNSSGVLPLRLS